MIGTSTRLIGILRTSCSFLSTGENTTPASRTSLRLHFPTVLPPWWELHCGAPASIHRPPSSAGLLSDRELATVLAALRHWQSDVIEAEDGLIFCTPHFDDHAPLSIPEVDALCERLNEQEVTKPQCDCRGTGYFHSGVPGVLAHVEAGQVTPDAELERCDGCQIYPSDAEVRADLARLGMLSSNQPR